MVVMVVEGEGGQRRGVRLGGGGKLTYKDLLRNSL